MHPAPPPTSRRPKEQGRYRARCLADGETYELMELVWSRPESVWAEGGQRPVCDECNQNRWESPSLKVTRQARSQ